MCGGKHASMSQAMDTRPHGEIPHQYKFGQGRNSVLLASDNILTFSVFSYKRKKKTSEYCHKYVINAPFKSFLRLAMILDGIFPRKIPVGNYGPVWDTVSILPFFSQAAHLHFLSIVPAL